MYYGFFALFSGCFLLSGVFGWWILPLLGLTLVAIPLAMRIPHPFIKKLRALHMERLVWLALATALQVVIVSIIYFVELHSVNPSIGYHQAVIYSGAANFALFVSLTPGAIGFRETFLLFSRDLHHISSANILTASLIDRAVYVIFLGVLFLVALSMHASNYLQARQVRRATDEATSR
jgi:uncharacterized membrane protein YbhN (UPF0104 family)